MSSVAPRSTLSLLEREGELIAIDARLRAAARGTGSLALIEGPAGIGKTQLIEAAIERATDAGMLVLRATGSEMEADFAFGIARQLFERPLAELSGRERGRVLAGVAGRAPLFLGVEHAAGRPATPESAFAALHALFWLTANIASRKATLIAVDDAHWADVASLRYLHFLARRVADLPVALLVALRPLGMDHAEPALSSLVEQAGQPLQPAPLSAQAVATLVRSQLGAATEPDVRFVEACQQATDGNVFLLTELLRTLRASGIEPTAQAAPRALSVAPDSVRRRVTLQLATLPRSAAALARAVVVLGEAELPEAAAQAGLEHDEARAAARELERASLLSPGRPLRFRHPMIAAAVTAGIDPGELTEAHARAARRLVARGGSSDAVATHLLRVEHAGDPSTVATLRRAAAAALDRGAPEAAVSYLRRASLEPPEEALRAEVLLELGRAELSSGAFGDAASTLQLALQAAPDPSTDAAIALALSQAYDFSGAVEDSIDVLDEARRRLGGRANDEAASIEHHLVAQAMTEPVWRAAVDERVRAWQDEARRGILEDPVSLALASGIALAAGLPASEWLPRLRLAAGDPRLRPYESALEVSSWAYNLAAMALEWSDCIEEADRSLSLALAESRRRGDAPQAAMFIACLARITFRSGRLPESESYCRLSEELRAGMANSAAFPFVLFDVLAEQGRVEEADRLIQTVPALGGAQNVAIVELMRGRIALAAGRPEAALEDLVRAGETLELLELRHPNFVPWRAHAVAAARQSGQIALARRYAEEDLEISRRSEVASAIGRALLSCALVAGDLAGDRAKARSLLEESCETLAGSPCRLDEAHSVVELGVLLRAEDRPGAREWLRRGLDLAHRCSATLLAARAHRELVAAGGRPRRPVTSGVDALTPSERQVARLAAEGMTNR